MKLILLALLLPLSARAVTLKYYGETKIAANEKFHKTEIGGLSGIAFHDGELQAISDDKGKNGEPRFYRFELKITKSSISLIPKEVIFFKGFSQKSPYLDVEALVRLSSGDIIISSENNNDRKPREMPRLLVLNSQGLFKSEITIPEKYLPEALGQQKKGLHNNFGFEGLTQTPDEKFLMAMNEAPLMTDLPQGGTELIATHAQWLRLLIFNAQSNYSAIAEYAYQVDALAKDDQKGSEVFRGVSEILSLDEKKILVLERGVRLTSRGLAPTGAIYLADLSAAQDVSHVANLSEHAVKAISKKKLVDFEKDLSKERAAVAVENFEGLAWGPTLPNGKKSLLVISDNNFAKGKKTEFLVFSVE